MTPPDYLRCEGFYTFWWAGQISICFFRLDNTTSCLLYVNARRHAGFRQLCLLVTDYTEIRVICVIIYYGTM